MNERIDVAEPRAGHKATTQLPGLSCLRAYVLAVQEGSYSRAAEMLGVSHAAVIQHVKGLEKQVGMPLVEKGGKALKATSSGAELYLRIRESVRLLEHAFLPAQSSAATAIRISTVPAFANGWLIPNLGLLRRRFVGVEFSIDASLAIESMAQSGADIAIRMGDGNWQDGASRALLVDTASPVASPSSPGALAVASPSDLLRLPLIENPLLPWSKWFAENGINAVDAKRALTVCDSYSAQLAAESGLGVALARASLVAESIRTNKLMHLLPSAKRLDATWWISVSRHRRGNQRLVAAVADALVDCARAVEARGANAALPRTPPVKRLVEA